MALTDERRAKLEADVANMQAVIPTVETDGWQEVLVPTFIGLRKKYWIELLNAKTIEEMLKAQCAIKSLNVIISDPERDIESDLDERIRLGKEAAVILAKGEEPKEEEEDKE